MFIAGNDFDVDKSKNEQPDREQQIRILFLIV